MMHRKKGGRRKREKVFPPIRVVPEEKEKRECRVCLGTPKEKGLGGGGDWKKGKEGERKGHLSHMFGKGEKGRGKRPKCLLSSDRRKPRRCAQEGKGGGKKGGGGVAHVFYMRGGKQ